MKTAAMPVDQRSLSGTVDCSLRDLMKSLRIEGDHADLTIECQGRQFDAHCGIVCKQSDVFPDMMLKYPSGSKKMQVRRREMCLPDDPQLVHRLLEYLYERQYSVNCPHDVGKAISSLYDEEDWFPLTKQETAPASKETSTCKENALPLNECVLHAEMYCLAEKYRIPGLKEHSRALFAKACEADAGHALHADFIERIFEHPDLEVLQELLIEAIRHNPQRSDMPGIFQALQVSHTFAQTLAHALLDEKLQDAWPSSATSSSKASSALTPSYGSSQCGASMPPNAKVAALGSKGGLESRDNAYPAKRCTSCSRDFTSGEAMYQHCIDLHRFCNRCCKHFGDKRTAQSHHHYNH